MKRITAILSACLIAYGGHAWAQPLPAPTTPLAPTNTVQCVQPGPGGATKGCTVTNLATALAPHAANNAALQALAHTAYPLIIRDGFTAAGDSPSLAFTSSASACTLNSGVGDLGSQVATSDGGCWNAVLTNGVTQGGLRYEWWGVSRGTEGSPGVPEIQLFVNASTGSDTNNYCIISSLPCATFTRAATEAQLFDLEGGNIRVKSQDSGAHTYTGSITVNGNPRGGASTTVPPSQFSPSRIILDGNSQDTILMSPTGVCYAILAENNAFITLENITIQANTQACADDLFVQQQGGIDIGAGVTLAQAGSAGVKAHPESSVYGIQVWAPFTITGSDQGLFSIGPNALVLINSGNVIISGSPTFGTALVYVGAGSVFQTNVACPFGANAWSGATNYTSINTIVVGSDNNCYAIVAASVPNLNHNPVGDGGTHWTLLLGTLPVPTAGAFTGTAFQVLPGGSIEPQLNPIFWPGSAAGQMQGGTYRGDGALVGSIPTITAVSGIGGSGTAAIAGGSYNSAITLSPNSTGGAISASGNITVSFPFQVEYNSGSKGHCTVTPSNDASAWASGATAIGAQPNGVGNFIWNNNGTNLSNTPATYTLNVVCGAGS